MKIGSESGELTFFGFLFMVSLFLSWNLHRNNGYFNWKSDIWADRAGYFVYLPATFLHGFDISSFPEKIDEKTGYGFVLDPATGKVTTKYTCGVAMLLTPFYIPTHLLANLFHLDEAGGFGPVYHKMIGLAAIVYLILGLWFLNRFLSNYLRPEVRYFTLFFIYAGTNLLYYTVDDPMMSHVYSFFLFCLFLYSIRKFYEGDRSLSWFLLLSFSVALSALIRPTNILILGLFFLWDLKSWRDFGQRIRFFFKPVYFISFVVVLLVVFLPQLIYWKYLTGSWIFYSYGNEGFRNWASPRFAEVWFSTLNGLFLYNPLYLVILAGITWMIIRRKRNGILLLAIFLAVSYLCAAWKTWYFGCSYGQRSFVEYTAILALPFGMLLESVLDSRRWWVTGLVSLVVVGFSFYSIRMIYGYERCFFGSTWDGGQFLRQLEKSGLYKGKDNFFSFRNDFENQVYNYLITDKISRSGLHSVLMDPEHEFSGSYTRTVWDFYPTSPGQIRVTLYFYKTSPEKLDAFLVCSVEHEGKNLYWEGTELEHEAGPDSTWLRTDGLFRLPSGLPVEAQIKLYTWNRELKVFCIDDMYIRFEE